MEEDDNLILVSIRGSEKSATIKVSQGNMEEGLDIQWNCVSQNIPGNFALFKNILQKKKVL